MKILLVDDSRATRSMIRRMLARLDAEVLEAENGVNALQVLAAHGAVDAVLVDWNMPVMTGIDFVREVRKQPAYERMPIMMVTTETGIEQLQSAVEAGANEYLMKPFTEIMLLEKLQLLGLCEIVE